MWKASANLILINPETVVREQTLKTFFIWELDKFKSEVDGHS